MPYLKGIWINMECMHGVHGVPRGARGPLSVKEFRYEDKNLGKVEKTQEMGICYKKVA